MSEIITILKGKDKTGRPETVDSLEIKSGQIYSVVGFTGSGKSQLISDIEQMAQRDTITERKILVNGQAPDYTTRYDPDAKLVAQLSQNMNFALEMGVRDFLLLHGECRGVNMSESLVAEVMEYVNSLAGEPVKEDDILTRLSGGQSRALMIVDVAVISNSPVILVDEVENAGIDRRKAMDLLAGKGKIVLLVTHDPLLALMGERRIVMKNGGMSQILNLTEEERKAEHLLKGFTEKILTAQNRIRRGEALLVDDLIYNQEKVLC